MLSVEAGEKEFTLNDSHSATSASYFTSQLKDWVSRKMAILHL